MMRELIRQSDLINQLVLDRSTLEELGRVELLWMYPPAHRVLGFICKSGFLGSQKSAFQLSQIEILGESGVLTQDRPEKTTAERVRRLESLLDHEIWSEDGNRIGKITDCLFQLQTGEITQYLFVSSGWTGVLGELYQLLPSQILGLGKQRIRVSTATQFELYQSGLSQKLSQKFSQEISQRAEATTEQAKEQLQQLQQLTEQAKIKAQQLSQQLNQRAQVLKAQVSETTQTLLEQVESGFETLSIQVEEAFESIEAANRPNPRSSQAEPSSGVADAVDDALNDRSVNGQSVNGQSLDTLDDDIWGDDWEIDPPDIAPQPEDKADSAEPTSLNQPAHSVASEDVASEDLEDDQPWI